MKKLLTLTLLSLTAFTLAGCNSGSGTPFGPTTDVDGYAQYSAEALSGALATGDDVVLFFGATRCPPCMKLHNDIEANISDIPENLTILTTDFDLATDLKEQYGVTQKHTAVYFSPDGSIKKMNSAKEHTLQDIVDEIGEEVE